MPRLINLADHKNLWGATTSDGLEPQRSDLWLVDLTQVVNGLNSQGIYERLGLAAVPSFLPQFVQAVTLPEVKLKPEVFRRDSVPFNMPSWDEPLDPVRISFLMDTYQNPNQSMVTSLLQAWTAIVRAGRGDRTDLYTNSQTAIPLNGNYRYDYTFPIRVALLRGGSAGTGGLSAEQVGDINAQMAFRSSDQNNYQQKYLEALAAGDTESASTYQSLLYPEGTTTGPNRGMWAEKRPLQEQPWLQVASNWLLKDCWLASWKVSDLTYADCKLVTVDAIFYAEDIFESVVT